MSDKAKWGYLAGIVDGEGHITISRGHAPVIRKNRKNVLDDTSVRFAAVIGVTNTDMRLSKWLKEHFGGQYYSNKPSKNGTWKQSHKWYVTSNKEKEKILLGILPYLVLKREQANIALAFIRMNGEVNRERRQELYEKITSLNRRGKLVETNTSGGDEPKIESELIGNNESAPDVNPGSDSCDVPPFGWWCSRQKGHDGPCAARPISDLALNT